jgi:hypothetical protein
MPAPPRHLRHHQHHLRLGPRRADIFEETIEVLDEIEADNPKFMILTPLPGTATFARMHEEGRILTYDWSGTTSSTPSSSRSA